MTALKQEVSNVSSSIHRLSCCLKTGASLLQLPTFLQQGLTQSRCSSPAEGSGPIVRPILEALPKWSLVHEIMEVGLQICSCSVVQDMTIFLYALNLDHLIGTLIRQSLS